MEIGFQETLMTLEPAETVNAGESGGAIGVALPIAYAPVWPAELVAATRTKIAEPFTKPLIVTEVEVVE